VVAPVVELEVVPVVAPVVELAAVPVVAVVVEFDVVPSAAAATPVPEAPVSAVVEFAPVDVALNPARWCLSTKAPSKARGAGADTAEPAMQAIKT
jgi:hypothetical protein